MTYSNDLREKIREKYDELKSFRATAKAYKVSDSTVKRIVLGLNKARGKRRGPRPKTSPKNLHMIKRSVNKMIQNDESITANKVLKSSNITNVSVRTMRRILVDIGNAYQKAKRQIILTDEHKQRRVELASDWLANNYDFSKVVWTDEKRFNLDGPDNFRSWYPRDKLLIRNRRQQGGGTVQVWGMLIPGPFLVVLELHHHSNSLQFVEFIKERVLPIYSELTESDYTFQQDNASTHVSTYSTGELANLGLKLLPWPARSPDLNPIENVWSRMAAIVYEGKQYKNKAELWVAIDAAVTQINVFEQDFLSNLCGSIRRRLVKCIDEKGGPTGY